MILFPFPHRPDYRLREAAERRVVAQIKRRMQRLLADFECKANAHIVAAKAKALNL